LESIWELYESMSRRLLRWSALSVLVGITLILVGGTFVLDLPFLRGFGLQAILWGLIDAGIAVGGRWLAQRRQAAWADAAPDEASEMEDQEARRLHRLLWINVGLDVLYVAGGVALALTLGSEDGGWRGHGWGIVAQGAFLFAFDLIHAQSVPLGLPRDAAQFYSGEQHQPFFWQAVEGPPSAPVLKPAALLVHGYMGTPAEIRALAQSLHGAGWTVQGLLLPGFGPDIESLPQRRHGDWRAALLAALEALQQDYSPVLLVGYSMGGALSAAVTSDILVSSRKGEAGPSAPDGLLLLAPFTQVVPALIEALWRPLHRFLPPYVRPLRWASFSQPHLRHSIYGMMPGIDLDDPSVRRTLREIAVPISIVSGLLENNRVARREGLKLDLPVLVLQGAQDEVARPRYTRRLVRRLGPGIRYIEVDGGHSLVYPSEPIWPTVEQAVLEFAADVIRSLD
jgi:carboxylesterase